MKKFLLAALLLSTTITSRAEAGPWTKAPGEGYAKVSTAVYTTSEHMISSPTGLQYIDGAYVGSYTGVYTELGILPNLMGLVSLPFVYGMNLGPGDETYTNAGVGDVDFGAQLALPTPFTSALKVVVKVPFYSNLAAGIEGSPDYHPYLGEGQVDVTAWLSVGHSFHPKPFYTYLDIGYRHRTEAGPGPLAIDFRDAFVYLVQGGYASDSWIVTATSQGQILFEKGAGGNKSFAAVGLAGYRALNGGFWLGLEAESELLSTLGPNAAPLGKRGVLALAKSW